ncbi:MAG TPA: maleylpyruvate isomerase N-terminal domain-containing protein [Dehalococcoidia bacterium]|nr:maleylpyruvate isomerase N-terminal domain-containing protein [Dehalococcoidia bacterium]
MPDASILNDNAAVTARLEALVARLSDADLGHDLGGGWTVSVALSHLAFWDRRIAYMLGRWVRDGTPHVELDDDVVNNALEAVHQAVEPRAAARLAVESAKAADAAIARGPDAIADQLIAEDHAYLLRRTGHRTEHIEQIEAALRG